MYNKPSFVQYKKNKTFYFYKFFTILKCVTKRECVTSQVRKDTRGYCNCKNIIYQNIQTKFLVLKALCRE